MLWKGGAKTDLSDIGVNAMAESVYVDGNNVYVSGVYYNGTDDVGAVWVSSDGGAHFDKTSLTDSARAYSVYVDGGNVYAAGVSSSASIAAVWISSDGGSHFSRTPLPADGTSMAQAVYVKEGIIYAAGVYFGSLGNYVTTVWVSSDGGDSYTKTYISNPSFSASATSIYVANGIIYVAGYYCDNVISRNIATVWVSSNASDTCIWSSKCNKSARCLRLGLV